MSYHTAVQETAEINTQLCWKYHNIEVQKHQELKCGVQWVLFVQFGQQSGHSLGTSSITNLDHDEPNIELQT